YREFQDGAAYLDIETAGSRAGDTVTCVAVADRRGVRLFVRDRNLDDLPDALRDHDVLVTFNGASFDLPVLRHALRGAGAAIDRLAHFDVCHALRRLGHHGGLKLAERSFGVPRDDGLHGLDGSFAVELWERHLRGDPRALPTLARYCAEDVLGLPALASLAANALLAETPFAGELAPIPVPGRIESYLPFSRALVSELVAARAAAVVSRPAERLGDAFE
ncbi:MAG TPA: ribonuclease H-like domain-containing protein, partial [Planctomycetota bacterium]|nr:ribonuclease H-like domain-containing protein [Planctomycetota bacterium]